ALSEAWLLTGRTSYQNAISETIAFLTREMQHPGGAFYAALDADSEGVEGKYYVWQKAEIEKILGHEAELFCLVYDVETTGNWEDSNILWLPQNTAQVASDSRISEKALLQVLDRCRKKLLSERQKRVAPGLDNKILLSWNALLISALCSCGAALQMPSYIATA